MFDVDNVTLEEIDDEYGLTLDKLERLTHLRKALLAQEHRRVKFLVAEYNIAQFNAQRKREKKA